MKGMERATSENGAGWTTCASDCITSMASNCKGSPLHRPQPCSIGRNPAQSNLPRLAWFC